MIGVILDVLHKILELLLRPVLDDRFLDGVGISYATCDFSRVGRQSIILHAVTQNAVQISAYVNGSALLEVGNQLLILPCTNHAGCDVLDGHIPEIRQNVFIDAVGLGRIGGRLVARFTVSQIQFGKTSEGHILAPAHLIDKFSLVLFGFPFRGKSAFLDLLVDSLIGAVAENRIPFSCFLVFVLTHDVILLL